MGNKAVHTRVLTKTTLYLMTNEVTMNASHPVEHQVKCADVYFIEILRGIKQEEEQCTRSQEGREDFKKNRLTTAIPICKNG